MAKVNIDGQLAEVEDGVTVIRAAERLGIEIPHYCWHPGLSIAGNCRMCLVEIEKVPKLQIACNTRVADGMVVFTRNERVKKAQAAVLEFLLLNHPIDCPICDQAGECKLQDYYMDFDQKPSRFPVEEKNRKRKVVELGPRVVLDQERCILCLRCTRFLDEVTKTSELGAFERGDRAFIDLAAGRRLDNGYSENVVDICPVGALTSREFRFQARVWYLTQTPSVCTSCSTGCNVDVFHRQGQIFRLRPRYQPEVNQFWMCDRGRDAFRATHAENRLLVAERRVDERMESVEWPQAIAEVAGRLHTIAARHGVESVAVIVSAKATNEEAYLLSRVFGSRVVGHAWSPPEAVDDGFLLRSDWNPNRRGLETLGIPTGDSAVGSLLDRIRGGEVRGLLVFGADVVGELGREVTEGALEKLEYLAVCDGHRTETTLYADVVWPLAAFGETRGTITNATGRVQRLGQAFPPHGDAREGWKILIDLATALGVSGAEKDLDEIEDSMVSENLALRSADPRWDATPEPVSSATA
jgi:NADH-quinone oxidoreductase subunit G